MFSLIPRAISVTTITVVLCLIQLSILSVSCTNVTKFTMFLRYQEPYAVKHNEMTGIIPEQLEIINRKCPGIHIDLRIVSWPLQESKQIATSSNPITLIQERENIRNDTNLILGAWSRHHTDHTDLFGAYPLVWSPGMVVIVHRDRLAPGAKLFRAIGDSMLLMYNGVLVAAFVGIFVWCMVSNFFLVGNKVSSHPTHYSTLIYLYVNVKACE